MGSIRNLFRGGDSEKQRLRERIAYLEGMLAAQGLRARQPELDEATKKAIEQRTEEIMKRGYRDRADEAKRALAERLAYHEVLDEQRRQARAAEN
jgi:hypothetical protein